jgi:transposase
MGNWRRHSDRACRAVLRSPGRPPVSQREDRRQFWTLIAEGLSSERAAIVSGVSTPVGVRWFREAGGIVPAMFAPSSKPLSGRYLSFAEREEITLWRAQGLGVCEIGRRLDRSASTISRELRRVQSRGALRRELTACLRTGRALRVPQARSRRIGKSFVAPEIMISQRPAEAADRAVPGHWDHVEESDCVSEAPPNIGALPITFYAVF